jgi:signal transduction histidine kinase
MWRVPYICFLISVFCPNWYQTILFGLLCALLVFTVTWVVSSLRLRRRARAIRAHFDERLAEQTRIARELHDNMLQTVQGSKFVADDALEKSNDMAYMRLTLERLSNWLGHATQEAQAALTSLPTTKIEKNDD